ncbi:LLM class flavin-dependent oxidoreductase [Amycolatopsis sp. K13G38]|uniref:LLM class flavin-dependent oxidoreductase n=1 Tax=Amycolatopsis acididurans TaxID=2724524 RepID=A0ABX1JCJ7_9PSEU|nr:LLM class flavin-dependent oxidoreductase [Amycolatopsis acididurans]NKQ56966.1 LLM class flavin-dependent oxidoreductase [Amycolatopsis acididurans]
MRLGVSLAYWPWFEIEEQFTLAKLADRLGFESLWVAEGYGQDGVALLGALSSVTERIGLGAGILQIPARQPATTAMAASTVDRLSGGRMLLGLGLSGPQVSEGWYGVPFTAPLRRTREYIDIIRQALSGAPLEYEGREWTLPVREGLGLGKPLKLLGAPVQNRIPIYLGVGGAKTVEQAGALADGWLPFLFSPEHADMLTAPLIRGIEKAGRRRSDVVMAPTVPAALHDDLDTARDLVRPMVAFYLGGMGAKDKNFYVELAERYGHGASAHACQDRFLAGDRKGAAAALSPELLDLVALTATSGTLEKKLSAYETAGVDTLVVTPFGDRPALLKALAPNGKSH